MAQEENILRSHILDLLYNDLDSQGIEVVDVPYTPEGPVEFPFVRVERPVVFNRGGDRTHRYVTISVNVFDAYDDPYNWNDSEMDSTVDKVQTHLEAPMDVPGVSIIDQWVLRSSPGLGSEDKDDIVRQQNIEVRFLIEKPY